MKSITLTVIAAAMLSACAITPDQGSTMPLERSPQAVPASSNNIRHEATPNIDLQIYDNPDLHLAALEFRTIS